MTDIKKIYLNGNSYEQSYKNFIGKDCYIKGGTDIYSENTKKVVSGVFAFSRESSWDHTASKEIVSIAYGYDWGKKETTFFAGYVGPYHTPNWVRFDSVSLVRGGS